MLPDHLHALSGRWSIAAVVLAMGAGLGVAWLHR